MVCADIKILVNNVETGPIPRRFKATLSSVGDHEVTVNTEPLNIDIMDTDRKHNIQ